MTYRVNYLTVALTRDMREDDAQKLIAAVEQLSGVLKVEANVVQPDAWIAERRVRADLTSKLWYVLEDYRP